VLSITVGGRSSTFHCYIVSKPDVGQVCQRGCALSKPKIPPFWESFTAFVNEFKDESDRAAVILGAAKLDALLAQILDRHLLPCLGNNDELLDGDSPLSTFSARINICYRLGLITPEYAKSLHLVRRIRNSFAHEISGVSLQTGSHSDRLKSLIVPLQNLPFFSTFRNYYFGEASPPNDFRACLALMAARLEALLENVTPCNSQGAWQFILEGWRDEKIDQSDDPKSGPV
jgi:hypothetical protein